MRHTTYRYTDGNKNLMKLTYKLNKTAAIETSEYFSEKENVDISFSRLKDRLNHLIKNKLIVNKPFIDNYFAA